MDRWNGWLPQWPERLLRMPPSLPLRAAGREDHAWLVVADTAAASIAATIAAPGREPDAAMAIVHALALDDYQSLRSTRAAYERALLLARAEPERRFLERRLDEL
jgi:hypothetical protein